MNRIFFPAIIILSLVLRLYQLQNFPALNADEAAIGYNAYSLLQTGKDEHGNFWPIHFQSFNDYKPGLYFYIVLPFIALLGLNELAVKLPGAILGAGTVVAVWFLVKELFPHRKWLPEISALFLAVSPWHLHFSRGGWEVNAATFFLTSGLLFFLKGLRSARWLYLSALFFTASLYTYHTVRIVAPFLIGGLVVWRREDLLPSSLKSTFIYQYMRGNKHQLLSALVGLILLIPLLVNVLGPAGISRFSGVGLLADEGPFWKANRQRSEHGNTREILALALHNRPVNYGVAFLDNYLRHFSGEFLFMGGDEIQRNKVPDFGQLYVIQAPFLIFGFLAVARSISGWQPILLWLFLAPIPAALTFQSPHALRAQNMVIPLAIISALGLLAFLDWLKEKVSKKTIFVVCCVLFVVLFWDFTRYLHQYYVHMAKTYPYSSQYGVKELADYIKANGNKFSKIIVTDRYDQPYILFLFYLKYPPDKFQEAHELTPRDQFGFSTVRSFDKYNFVSVNWNEMRDLRSVLLVGAPEEISDVDANIVKRIYFPGGQTAFEIVPL